MKVTIKTGPDEETPLLGGQQASAVEQVMEAGSETVTLAGPSNQGSRTPSTRGKPNANGMTEVAKKTPLPWRQFSLVLLLQFTEPLTSMVIYPVGSSAFTFPSKSLLISAFPAVCSRG